MDYFPQIDPIPLPAPVWLFKGLEVLTMTLHFLAMQLLVGGLLTASVWAIFARWKKSTALADGAGVISARLPVVMTYVINFGVPPLLFAQVLYGRALYTSSVLIGVFWISIVFLLMIAYTFLYWMSSRVARRRPAGLIGFLALAIVLAIGMIFSSNMTLMLSPEVWREMYRADAFGIHLNHGDPTVVPRWLFMMLGGLTVSGAGLLCLGQFRRITPQSAELSRQWGGRIAALGVLAQAALGYWVLSVQPGPVREALAQSSLYQASLFIWIGLSAGVFGSSIVGQLATTGRGWLWPIVAGVFVFLQTLVMVIYRGGIRDATLAQYGFNVWDREVSANWVVVGVFLLVFVMGLAAVGWLASVVFRARDLEENHGRFDVA